MNHSTEKIDIHHMTEKLAYELRRIPDDPALLPDQRRTLLRFLSDARTGCLPGKRAGRKLSDGRCLKIISTIRRFGMYVRVPFEDVTVPQMQEFILGLESGQVPKLIALGGNVRYTPDTVLDFKKIIRRFYRWLLGDSVPFKDLTYWFDTREQPPELRVFDLDTANRLAQQIGVPQGQALVMGLFDGGFRAGEFFNIRLSDIRFAPDTDGTLTCFVRVRVSKTKPRTISLPIATEAIRFWIERHPAGGPLLTDGTIQAKDPSATLCTWSYAYCRRLLREAGRDEIGERLYFHRFRHASATFYARHLTEYQMCARYGWTMGSRAVRRYVEASGILAEDTASIMRRTMAAAPPRIPMTVQPAPSSFSRPLGVSTVGPIPAGARPPIRAPPTLTLNSEVDLYDQ
ncbi:MAG: hypothetical protein ACREJO_15590 [Phycisphaerales bacterium]